MAPPSSPADLTALELRKLFLEKKLSPVEVAAVALSRIEALNGTVNAYCFLDPDTTLEQARLAERRYQQGQPLSGVDGVPVAIKDVFLTRGWPTRKGSKTIPDQPGQEDAPAVRSLRAHGAVFLGKTTTPELGWKGVTDNPLTGVTRNPWDPEKTAGGSSGGSGAAVPLGMGPLALGTDAGGSIRIPASLCGIVGFKPTHGLAPLWPQSVFGVLAHVGPMTRTVQDAALLLDVISRPDERDPTLPASEATFLTSLQDELPRLKIAVSLGLGYASVDAEIRDLFLEAARLFEDMGMIVERRDPGFPDPTPSFERLFYGGASSALRDIPDETKQMMDPALVEAARDASSLTMLDYLHAVNERANLIETLHRFHRQYDLLVTPTLPIPAFRAGREVPDAWPHKRWHTWSPLTYPFNVTGQPALSVPCGFTKAGLPVGLQIVGARHNDRLVLSAGHRFQAACALPSRRPRCLEAVSSSVEN